MGVGVADMALEARRRPDVRRWLVAGTGLDRARLAALRGTVEFAAPVMPRPGIDRASWRRSIALGEVLEVRGSVSLAEGEVATLTLAGPAGVEANAELTGSSTFALNALPRQPGRPPYRLELVGAAGLLAREVVDVEVTVPRLPRLLWLEGAPGFESREVKAWLRDLGGALVVRTQLSRGRFRYDYLNQERIDAARLNSEVLAQFDLLVIDGPAWSALSSTERAEVGDAVASGLGLVLIPTLPRLAGGNAPPGSFATEAVGDLEQLEVTAEGPGLPPLAPLTLEARQFTVRPGQRTLVKDAAGRALAVSRPLGLGQVAATLMGGTYRWALRGDGPSHRLYWSRILATVARPAATAKVSFGSGPIRVDQPVSIECVARHEAASVLEGPEGDARSLAWAQDPLEPRRWHATVWPQAVGWHRVAWGEDSFGFYAASANAWSSWQERQAYDATMRRAALGAVEDGAAADESVPQPLPRWPLFAALLIAWALLWANEQWRGVAASE